MAHPLRRRLRVDAVRAGRRALGALGPFPRTSTTAERRGEADLELAGHTVHGIANDSGDHPAAAPSRPRDPDVGRRSTDQSPAASRCRPVVAGWAEPRLTGSRPRGSPGTRDEGAVSASVSRSSSTAARRRSRQRWLGRQVPTKCLHYSAGSLCPDLFGSTARCRSRRPLGLDWASLPSGQLRECLGR